MRPSELTTAQSWDRLWRQPSASLAPRLRGRARWVELLRRLLDTSGPGSADVLELGCAPGAMLEQLHSLRPDHRYRGIDISPDGLALARRRLASRDIPADLELGDIRDADVAPADIVMSFGLAEHFADPVEALRYHRRFVKQGGHVALTVPDYAHPLVVFLLRACSPETLATHNLALMSAAAMRRALRAAGFVDVRAGVSGGPTLPSSRPRPGPAGSVYRFMARGWNVASRPVPEGWPWSTSVWGVGCNPG